MPLWGIDLGGTKIEGVILRSVADPEVILRERIDTQAERGYGHILSRIQDLLQTMSEETGIPIDQVGIGTPGSIDPPTGLLKNSNTTCLNGKPLKKDLEKLIDRPVVMANDANCFALAETRMGIVPQVCPDAEVVFGVIMGTGVGGGLVVRDQVVHGRNGIAGEWGHNFLDASGGPCYCGRHGCVERILSGKHLERWHQETFGESKKLQEIYQAHLDGTDPNASRTIDRLLNFFGKALAQVINIVDPDVIVLGGGVGNIDLLYTQGVETLAPYVFNPRMETIITRPALGDSAGVYGAAWLVA